MISEIARKVNSAEAKAADLVREALAKAKEYKDYNVFISLSEKSALERAKEIDARVARGENVGRLAGVPFAAKDNFLTKGDKTTAASKMLENLTAPLSATAVEKLEAEGAICIGKTNLDAFAHGSSTENSYFGPTLNAKDKGRVAGGSSGGSAVAVALGIVPLALGSDTGGSIRQPAGFNGVVGVKPSHGAVSRFGVIAMASSTDVVGVLAGNTDDARLAMRVLAGKDTKDGVTIDGVYGETAAAGNSTIRKVAVIRDFMSQDVDPEVRQTTRNCVEALKSAGHTVEEIDLPWLKYSLAVYYIVGSAEVASNLALYDGIRYGLRSEKAKTLQDLYGSDRDQGFMPENKRRILMGNFVLSSGYYDAYYQKAQKVRTLIINDFTQAFGKYDALIGPVSPTPAFKLGEKTSDPIKMYLEDILSVPASIAGLPALSVPAGTSKAGLPIGVQVIGPHKSDEKLLALAQEIERGVKSKTEDR